jgi:hypothetical protein
MLYGNLMYEYGGQTSALREISTLYEGEGQGSWAGPASEPVTPVAHSGGVGEVRAANAVATLTGQ